VSAQEVRLDLRDRAPLRSGAPVQCNCSNNTRNMCSRALPSATVAEKYAALSACRIQMVYCTNIYQLSKRAGVFNCRPNLFDRSDCCCISAGLWSIIGSDTIAAVDAALFLVTVTVTVTGHSVTVLLLQWVSSRLMSTHVPVQRSTSH
jgi:hypothetical protein